jgi:hypothetical protein
MNCQWLNRTRELPEFKNKVVIHKNNNRHNPEFPWEAIVKQNDCVFVSSDPEEFEQFPWKSNVSWVHAPTIEDIANVISNGKFFVGGMSAPSAIAWAIGTPSLIALYEPDAPSYMVSNIYWYLSKNNNNMTGIPILYNTESSILLNVSVGEAIDKLSILQIKTNYIKDESKLQLIRNEINSILPSIQPFISQPSIGKEYNNLLHINELIWNAVDTTRNSVIDETMQLNDQRFRIKDIINSFSNSIIKEQKNF